MVRNDLPDPSYLIDSYGQTGEGHSWVLLHACQYWRGQTCCIQLQHRRPIPGHMQAAPETVLARLAEVLHQIHDQYHTGVIDVGSSARLKVLAPQHGHLRS